MLEQQAPYTLPLLTQTLPDGCIVNLGRYTLEVLAGEGGGGQEGFALFDTSQSPPLEVASFDHEETYRLLMILHTLFPVAGGEEKEEKSNTTKKA